MKVPNTLTQSSPTLRPGRWRTILCVLPVLLSLLCTQLPTTASAQKKNKNPRVNNPGNTNNNRGKNKNKNKNKENNSGRGSVSFKNRFNVPVEVYRVDRGKEERAGYIAPNGSLDKMTSPGELWRFKINGQVVATYRAEDKPKQSYAIVNNGSYIPPTQPVVTNTNVPNPVTPGRTTNPKMPAQTVTNTNTNPYQAPDQPIQVGPSSGRAPLAEFDPSLLAPAP